MNEILERRYSALFASYGIGSSPALVHAKERIGEILQNRSNWLRPDAAYFLLVNIEEMIRIPCSGYIPISGDLSGQPIDFHIHPNEIFEKIDNYLSALLNDLDKFEEAPISAHAILRSVDRNWSYAADIFFW